MGATEFGLAYAHGYFVLRNRNDGTRWRTHGQRTIRLGSISLFASPSRFDDCGGNGYVQNVVGCAENL
jgi:hypothetical protein